jgi:hypothetical protein
MVGSCGRQTAISANYGYWIVCPKTSVELPKIAAFRAWLLAEAAEDSRRLRELDDRQDEGGKVTPPSRRG